MTKEVFAYLETHWDREWYKTFEEFRLRLCDVMNDIFQKLENNEINSFYLDGQTIALNDYLEIFPDKKEYVTNLIKNEKLFVGPFYDLADEFLVNGESLARNLLIGINETINYGANPDNFVGYLPDAFGHSAWLPMLFVKSKINKAIVWRGVKDAMQEFLWKSPDGSKIKTVYLPAGYFQDFFSKKSYAKNLNALLEKLEKYTDNNTPILLPVGADHLACEDIIKSKIKNFNRNNKKFKIKLSSLKEYFESTKDNTDFETITGELRNNANSNILASVFSSKIHLKQQNMLCQWRLGKIVEPLYSLMLMNNLLKSKKENTDYAWKTLIQNHAHDSICGCSLDAVHRENEMRFEKVLQICNSLLDNAKYNLAEKISKKELGLINLSNYDFSGVISFYSDKKLPLPIVGKKKLFPIEISQDIHNIPVQEHYKYYYEYLINVENLKGMSFAKQPFNTIKNTDLKLDKNTIENEFLQVKINNDGTLNLKNKLSNIEFKNIFKITNEADVGDSYNFSCILNDSPIVAEYKKSQIIEDNSLRKVLRLTYEMLVPSHAKNINERSKKLLKHIFDVDLILTIASKRLDIKINYENYSKDQIIKVNFNLPKSIEKTVSEDTFGVIERNFIRDYNYKDNLPKEKFKETDININCMQRFVMAENLCVLTKGLQEYEVFKNNLNITILRSFGCISRKTLLTRTSAAGPPLPTPEGQCLGKQTAELSLMITDNENEAFKEADFYYNPIIAVDGKGAKSSLNAFDFINIPEPFYVYNIKEAENRDGVIVKVFNLSDKMESLSLEKNMEIFEVNLLEEEISCINDEILFNPNELKIFKFKA